MPKAMAPPPSDPADATDGGASKAKKGWGDRVKEMKERAEKAKAGLNKSKEKVATQ